jgi:ABC-2 type transport system ATP-binding protein
MTNQKMIEVKNVSFSYERDQKALDQVSFDVMKNQTVGLLGPNGGGKTTLFKIISSLIRCYEGDIYIDGLDCRKNLKEVLKKIGVVFQSPSLDKKLTVEENLFYQGRLYGLSKKEILTRMDELLTTLSIQDRKKQLVQNLSGGLARRVEIVKSLIHSPSVLILDEPSTGLDIGVRIDLWNLLKQIQTQKSVTILLTTHFIEEADRCDQIVLLNQGKILSSGSPLELKNKLTHKQFRLKPRDFAQTVSLLSDQGIAFNRENGYLHFQTAAEKTQALIAALTPQVEELTYSDPTLEDVFMHYAGRRVTEAGHTS